MYCHDDSKSKDRRRWFGDLCNRCAVSGNCGFLAVDVTLRDAGQSAGPRHLHDDDKSGRSPPLEWDMRGHLRLVREWNMPRRGRRRPSLCWNSSRRLYTLTVPRL